MTPKTKRVVAWGYGILNHLGEFWSNRMFHDKEEAQKYIDGWKISTPNIDLSKHRIIAVEMRPYRPLPRRKKV